MSDAGDVPSLADLPAAAQRVALAYYEAGLDHGYDLGFRAAQAQQERAWAAFAQFARAATAAVPYDELCERRGESPFGPSRLATSSVAAACCPDPAWQSTLVTPLLVRSAVLEVIDDSSHPGRV